MTRLIRWSLVGVALLGTAFWWFALDARAPAHADGVFDIAAYRRLVAGDRAALPRDVRVEIVGADVAPLFAAEAGAGLGDFRSAYTSFQLVAPGGNIIIDAAVDRSMANQLSRTGHPFFSASSYRRILAAMLESRMVLLTHEHRDHVIAVARHPDPVALAPKLLLTQPQIAALPLFAPPGGLNPVLRNLTPMTLDKPRRVASGVVAIPAAGHSPGSIVIYVQTSSGREYMFIGDIVWKMSNIARLKTRPRFLQWIMFNPNEDRDTVLKQVRALHDLQVAEPKLIIVPSHDQDHLNALIRRGELGLDFVQHRRTE